MPILQEFKNFAMRGNVIDLAVGVIIGSAFGKIVTSVVEDLVMPMIAKAVGDIDFSNMYWYLGDKPIEANTSLSEAKKLGPVVAYGNFLTITINFMIVAAAIFVVVKLINKAKSRFEDEEKKQKKSESGPTQEQLLAEIRDLLKTKK